VDAAAEAFRLMLKAELITGNPMPELRCAEDSFGHYVLRARFVQEVTYDRGDVE
jgi:hypothetical protein